jgi:hypothetical protein
MQVSVPSGPRNATPSAHLEAVLPEEAKVVSANRLGVAVIEHRLHLEEADD